MKEKPTVFLYFLGRFLLTSSLRKQMMSEYFFLLPVAISINFTNEFWKLFEATTYQIPFIVINRCCAWFRTEFSSTKQDATVHRQTDRQTYRQYFYLSFRSCDSCRRLPEPKYNSFLFNHWSASKCLVFMAARTPSIHVFLGRPLFLLSLGIHSIINFGSLSSCILLTGPYHWSLFLSMMSTMSGQTVLVMFKTLYLMNSSADG